MEDRFAHDLSVDEIVKLSIALNVFQTHATRDHVGGVHYWYLRAFNMRERDVRSKHFLKRMIERRPVNLAVKVLVKDRRSQPLLVKRAAAIEKDVAQDRVVLRRIGDTLAVFFHYEREHVNRSLSKLREIQTFCAIAGMIEFELGQNVALL